MCTCACFMCVVICMCVCVCVYVYIYMQLRTAGKHSSFTLRAHLNFHDKKLFIKILQKSWRNTCTSVVVHIDSPKTVTPPVIINQRKTTPQLIRKQ